MAMLEVKNLGISFGGLRAVDDFNLSIEQGQLYGLIGPNGAGKTTVFNMLTGVYKPTDGKIFLDGEDISAEMHNMLKENIESSCKQFLAGDVKDEWDFGALRRHYLGWLTTDADFHYTVADYDSISQESIADMLYQRGMDVLNDKEQRYGAPLMRELERICLLKCVDRQWMDHIDNMDQLRQGIVLRGYGQKDPVVEYRIEGFDMFDQMVDSIRESSVKMLLTIEVREAGKAPKREQVAKPTGEGYVPGNGAPGAKGAPKGQPVRVIKIGRNDPCPCGSGLKWKKCTCAKYHPEGSHTEG